MNEQDEKIFLECLPFKRETKLHKIDEEVDRESFNSASGLSAAAEYNKKKVARKREERKSQVEINLDCIDFTDNSPEVKKIDLSDIEGIIEEMPQKQLPSSS